MERIYLDLPEEVWYSSIIELLFRLLGIERREIQKKVSLTPLREGEILLAIQQKTDVDGRIQTYSALKEPGRTYYYTSSDSDILSPLYRREDYDRRFLARAREGIYRVLSLYLKRDLSPWGVLLGVRPTKLVYSFFDRGFSRREIEDRLKHLYLLSEEKANLLLQVTSPMYSSISSDSYKRGISIYIGIPFCPSRCYYCSFPSESLKKDGRDLLQYMQALKEEIQMVGQILKRSKQAICSIYIGGGTPSILPTEMMEDLLLCLKEWGLERPEREFTLEAGRPETLTKEKLQVMYSLGVNRISINPQTIWSKTLERIGRQHTHQMIEDVYHLSKEIGFTNINMDLILGLPGEGFVEMAKSLERISSLQPDHITVHVLAKKRGAILEQYIWQAETMREIISFRDSLLQQRGMRPYYLYRQKDMAGDQENVGYAIPGKESFFNLAMMEERQTVIGLGSSAVSKLIHPLDLTMIRLQNPKLATEYVRNLKALLATKGDRLTKFLP